MNKNKGLMKKILVSFPLLLCLLLIKEEVAAMTGVSVELPVAQLLTVEHRANTDLPETFDEFQYTLTAAESGNPMPEGSTGETYVFAIKGQRSISLPPLVFQEEGIYQYRLEQSGMGTNDAYIYDREVYLISVYTKVQTDGTLRAEVTVARSSGEKVEQIDFHNRYETEAPKPDPQKPDPQKPGPQEPGSPKSTSQTSQKPAAPIQYQRMSSIVKTGDDTNIMLWAGLLLTNSLYMITVFVRRKREKSRE